MGQELSKSDRPELTSASTVISGGEWMGCVLKSGMKIEVQAGVGFIYKIISFDPMLCCLNSLNLKSSPFSDRDLPLFFSQKFIPVRVVYYL